jgi:hypothetical protein
VTSQISQEPAFSSYLVIESDTIEMMQGKNLRCARINGFGDSELLTIETFGELYNQMK